jgi:hypothetical protein
MITAYEIEKIANQQAAAIGGGLNLDYRLVTQSVDLSYDLDDAQFEQVIETAKAICQRMRDNEMSRIYGN